MSNGDEQGAGGVRDPDIRQALWRDLQEEHDNDPDTLILNELGLCRGDSRVDVAVINGAISGYEIKSERDTLARLPFQADVYSRTLDFVTIVANGHHLERIWEMVPPWWGVFEAVDAGADVDFVVHRRPEENPAVDPSAVVQLLWREEALEVLKERDLAKGLLSKPRQVLWEKLVGSIEAGELKEIVRSRLKARPNWRSDE